MPVVSFRCILRGTVWDSAYNFDIQFEVLNIQCWSFDGFRISEGKFEGRHWRSNKSSLVPELSGIQKTINPSFQGVIVRWTCIDKAIKNSQQLFQRTHWKTCLEVPWTEQSPVLMPKACPACRRTHSHQSIYVFFSFPDPISFIIWSQLPVYIMAM